MQVGNLTGGNTTSCGHSPCSTRWDWRRLQPGEQAQNVIFLNYQAVARAKGRKWELSRGQFNLLTALSCHYCGAEPANKTKDRWGEGAFVYNGLDRVDPTLGYTADNVVPCCITCNRAKADLTFKEFRAWLQRAASVTLEGGGRGRSVASRGE